MSDTPLKLGDYLILEKIAHGGMAQIYKAKTADPQGIERLVVIKRILPHISSNPEYVDMLIDEAKIAVHFNQGNIAQIYDLGRVGSDYFIVMEYVDGKTLGQILRDFNERGEPLPLDLIVYCMAEVCKGLDYMHRKEGPDAKPLGVVHRDISPQNIIVAYSGTVKIIDFGVAKSIDKLSQTESGVLKGKFAYMSPEQAEGDEIDRRSDIFAAGILLWELLTSQRLFKRKTNPETVKAVRKASVVPPSKLRADVPKGLDKIVMKALQKRRGARYPWASEMAADLSRLLHEINPDFRFLNVAQLLYRYFGPEADETALPAELPELNVPIKPKPAPAGGPSGAVFPGPDEEITEVDVLPKKSALKKVVWGFSFLFLAGVMVISFFVFFEGELKIEAKPVDATVFVEGKLLEHQPEGWVVKKSSGAPFQLRVMREGFEPFQSTERVIWGEKRVLEVNLRKVIPPFGAVKISSNPPGASVFLEGIAWNQMTPTEIPQLRNGKKYHIRLELEGHQAVEKEVEIRGGEVVSLDFLLQEVVEIPSSPSSTDGMIKN